MNNKPPPDTKWVDEKLIIIGLTFDEQCTFLLNIYMYFLKLNMTLCILQPASTVSWPWVINSDQWFKFNAKCSFSLGWWCRLDYWNCRITTGRLTRIHGSVTDMSLSRVRLVGLASVLLEGLIILIWKLEILAYILPSWFLIPQLKEMEGCSKLLGALVFAN